MRQLLLLLSALALLAAAASCSAASNPAAQPAAVGSAIPLASPAFGEGQTIPQEHTCAGADLSPALSWEQVPAGTKSLALTCTDADAGGFVHWLLYGLPPATRELPAGLPTTETLPNGARQGTNDFGRLGYGGPCPPPGKAHHYVFKLYALDTELTLPPKARVADLTRAMAGHILGEGQLTGQYTSR